ncbi:UNVERIFIED_CONTAM: hypothetical protein GTU68_016771 [Idotea baltica]|nr:hypothetical protein [Idotea baltica]
MHEKGIVGVDFVICNTDCQSLDSSKVINKVQLGKNGLGAGAKPEMGATATRDNLNEILGMLDENTKMVFITAGMGGGTGTGGAPIVAEKCKDLGLLTVGICTTPFEWEGPSRKDHAQEGIKALKEHVDTLIIISNDKLEEMYSDMDMDEAFEMADGVLATAAKGIAEIITIGGKVNVDFEDVYTVMENSGVAIMGTGYGSGEGRAMKAVQEALDSPLLNDNDIYGSKKILLNITYGSTGFKMNEFKEISRYVQQEAGGHADIIWGRCKDDALEDNLKIVLIATGFDGNQEKLWNNDIQVTKVDLEDTRVDNSASDESTLNTYSKGEGFNFSGDESDEKSTIQHFDLNSNYDEAMKRINDNQNRDSKDVSNDFNANNTEANNLDNGSNQVNRNFSTNDRTEKLKDLSFNTRPDSANLIKQKADYLKQKAAYETKNISFEKTLASDQNETSKSSVETTSDGEIKLGKNKFLHDGLD